MRAYVAVLTTDQYLEGALVLNESLKRVRSSHPLWIMLSNGVSRAAREILHAEGIRTSALPTPCPIPDDIARRNEEGGSSNWTYTLDKLRVFSLVQFSKLVYLDCDLLILRNIDHLFERPHLSAVAAGRRYPGNEGWTPPNSGLMVVEPDRDAYDRLAALIPATLARLERINRPGFSDQDVLHTAHPDWDSCHELHLDDTYNLFTRYIDHHVRQFGYELHGPDGIHVVHFLDTRKPWALSRLELHVTTRSLVKAGKQWELAALRAYIALLNRARLRIPLASMRSTGAKQAHKDESTARLCARGAAP